MKLLAKHLSLRSTYFIFAVMGFLTISIYSGTLVFSLRVHIVFLILAILLMFFPNRLALRKKEISTSSEKKPAFIKCVLLTFLLQICLYLSFYVICNLAGINMPYPPKSQALFQMTLPVLSDTWGLFPWGIYALIAAGLSYMRQSGHETNTLSTLMSPVLKNKPEDLFSLMADVSAKAMIAIALISTLGFIGMELVGLIAHHAGLPAAYGPRVDLILAVFLILHWNKNSTPDQYLKKLVRGKLSSTSLFVSFFLFMAIMVFLGLSWGIAYLSPRFTPHLAYVTPFRPSNWNVLWLIFTGVWWLSWAPMAAGWLAYVWRGYKIRTLIFWMLPLPVGVAVLSHTDYLWRVPFTLDASLWNLVPALLSLGLLYALFFRPQVLLYASKSSLPVVFKTYPKPPQFFLRRLFQGILMVMSIYWLMGIYAIAWSWFVMTHVPLLLILVAALGGFWRVMRAKSQEIK